MLNWVDTSIGYGQSAVLKQFNLQLIPGQSVAILGPSGAGKTTLLQHIHQQLKDQASLCAQTQGLVDNLSVYHNVFMGALGRHHWCYNLLNLIFPFKAPRQDVTRLCELLELECALSQQVQYLSGGQRQRVALARALYQEQSVFIGDEPFSALDPAMGERLLSQVLARHRSVICVLHDPKLAMAHFDRIIVLQAGTKQFDGPAAALTVELLAACYGQDEATGPLQGASSAQLQPV